MKISLRKRVAVVLLFSLLLSLFFAGCDIQEQEDDLQDIDSTALSLEEENELSDADEQGNIFVYVCGAVLTPGVYELPSGARLFEAVDMAGGVRDDAACEAVNQARILNDGEQIYIPTVEESKSGQEFCGEEVVSGQTGPSGIINGKVNINTASREELKTLNGIGDSRADSIISYRETNGSFQSIEDLMQVNGIKDGIFQKIKDDITVN